MQYLSNLIFLLLTKPSNQGVKVNPESYHSAGLYPECASRPQSKANAITLARVPSHTPTPVPTSPHPSAPPPNPPSWRLSTDPDTGVMTSLLDCGQAPLEAGRLSQPSLDHPQARCSFQHRASGHPAPSTGPLLGSAPTQTCTSYTDFHIFPICILPLAPHAALLHKLSLLASNHSSERSSDLPETAQLISDKART